MFTKIVDFFSAVVFSTTTVTSSLRIFVFDSASYPYGEVHRNFDSLTNLNSSLFEKPVYFLWDVNTFLQRWDLFITLSKKNSEAYFTVYDYPDCTLSTDGVTASTYSNFSTVTIPVGVFKELSNGLRLGYRFSNKILSLGGVDSYSVSILSLIDYYREKNDISKVDFFYKFLNSFINYDCKTGFTVNIKKAPTYVYLVPKWNNLSGINLRYFYLSYYHQFVKHSSSLEFSMLSVDLKGRYVDRNMLVYPVNFGSSYITINFPQTSHNYYASKYINLFSTGLSTSFNYNTIVIKLSTDGGSSFSTDSPVIRFMNFSMLDATTITGYSSDGNPSGWGLFDEVGSTICVWYDVFCHLTSAVKWVINNIIGFKQLFKLVNLFFTPMSLTLKTYKHYNQWFGDLPLVSPVIVSGAMLLVLFNFYRRFK